MQLNANPEQKTQLVWTDGTHVCGTTQPPRRTGGSLPIIQHVVTPDENKSPPCPPLHFHSPALGEVLIPQIPLKTDGIFNKNNKRRRSKTLSFPDSAPFLSSLLQGRCTEANYPSHGGPPAELWKGPGLGHGISKWFRWANTGRGEHVPMKGIEVISVWVVNTAGEYKFW